MRFLLNYFNIVKTNYSKYFKEKPIDGIYILYLLVLPIFANICYVFFTTLYKDILRFNEINQISKSIIIWFIIIILTPILIIKKLRLKFDQFIGYALGFFVLGVICYELTNQYISFNELKPKYFIFESHLPAQTEENNDEYFDNVDFDDYDFPEANLVFSSSQKDCVEVEKQLKLEGKIFDLKKLLFWQSAYLYGGKYQKFEDENEFDVVSIFFLFGPVIIVEIIISSVLKYSFSLFFLSLLLMLFKKSHLLKIK